MICLGDLNSLSELGVGGSELSEYSCCILFFLIIIRSTLRSVIELELFAGFILLVCVWLTVSVVGLSLISAFSFRCGGYQMDFIPKILIYITNVMWSGVIADIILLSVAIKNGARITCGLYDVQTRTEI